MKCSTCGEEIAENGPVIKVTTDEATLSTCARCADLQAGATEIQLAELRTLSNEHQQAHEQEKAYMAKERAAIVGWLRRLAGATDPIAKLIEDGQHWKDQS